MAAGRQHPFQKRDRLRQLRAFCHAAKLESLTQAAEHLRLRPSAVSLYVRELEHELRTKLFQRHGPRISLSPAGECFYEIAMPLVEGMDGLFGTFAEELEGLASGDVRISAGDAGTIYVLPRVVKRLRDTHPDICVRVMTNILSRGLDLLHGGEVDLVFNAWETVPEHFVYHPALSYDMVLITSLGHPLAGRDSVSREELAACSFIVPDAGTYSFLGGSSPLRQLGVETNAIIEVGGWEVIESYVEAGLGVAVNGSFCVTDPGRVSVIPLGQYFTTRSYGWFTRRDRSLTGPVERLMEAMEAEFPAPSQSAPGTRKKPAGPIAGSTRGGGGGEQASFRKETVRSIESGAGWLPVTAD